MRPFEEGKTTTLIFSLKFIIWVLQQVCPCLNKSLTGNVEKCAIWHPAKSVKCLTNKVCVCRLRSCHSYFWHFCHQVVLYNKTCTGDSKSNISEYIWPALAGCTTEWLYWLLRVLNKYMFLSHSSSMNRFVVHSITLFCRLGNNVFITFMQEEMFAC